MRLVPQTLQRTGIPRELTDITFSRPPTFQNYCQKFLQMKCLLANITTEPLQHWAYFHNSPWLQVLLWRVETGWLLYMRARNILFQYLLHRNFWLINKFWATLPFRNTECIESHMTSFLLYSFSLTCLYSPLLGKVLTTVCTLSIHTKRA